MGLRMLSRAPWFACALVVLAATAPGAVGADRPRYVGVAGKATSIGRAQAPTSSPSSQARFGIGGAGIARGLPADAVATQLKRLGATLHRVDANWGVVQPKPGQWHWSFVDAQVQPLAEAGIDPVLIVRSAPRWAADDSACGLLESPSRCQLPPSAAGLGAYREYVRRLVARYPRVAAVEVYNEPNLGSINWRPRADPETYVQVLRATREAVRGVRTDVPVVSGGLTQPGAAPAAGDLTPGVFLERMYRAGARGAMDGIGLHPYPGPLPVDHPDSGYRRTLADATRVRAAYGDQHTPFWFTELGYSTAPGPEGVGEADQARLLDDLLSTSAARTDVAAIMVYDLFDGPDARRPDQAFGLLRADGSAKPAFEVARRAAARLRRPAAVSSKRRSTRTRSRRTRTRHLRPS